MSPHIRFFLHLVHSVPPEPYCITCVIILQSYVCRAPDCGGSQGGKNMASHIHFLGFNSNQRSYLKFTLKWRGFPLITPIGRDYLLGSPLCCARLGVILGFFRPLKQLFPSFSQIGVYYLYLQIYTDVGKLSNRKSNKTWEFGI